MALGLFWKILFSVISLSLAQNWKDRMCTKQILDKFYIHKMDSHTLRVVSVEKTRKRINFVCCEGYREISRRNEFPNCEPICKQSCGYGYCYRPNLCACYYGYEIFDGTCKRIGANYGVVTKSVSPPKIEVESSTWRIKTKPSSTIIPDFSHKKFISNKGVGFETTISTRNKKPTKRFDIGSIRDDDVDLETTKSTTTQHHNSSEIESSTKASLRVVDDFPRVKFITYRDFGAGTTDTIIPKHKSFEVESSTRQIDTQASSRAVDDFPRVKFIKHQDSYLETRNPLNTQQKSSKVGSSPSGTIRNRKPFSEFWNEKEFAKYQTTSARRSKASTESSVDTIPRSSLRSIKHANCTTGVCTCQMGYQLLVEKFCHPCQIGSQCQCQDGYAFDSFRCIPLCNGAFDGCIRGTCIGYNECSCINGTGKSSDDIFRCYVKEANILDERKIDRKWYLCGLLLIPAIIAGFSSYIIMKRSRTSKSNRLKAQRHNFPEIRYFHTNNNLFVQSKYHETDGKMANESCCGEHVIHQDGNIVIVKV